MPCSASISINLEVCMEGQQVQTLERRVRLGELY